jgi:hypothetical protein
MPPRVLLADYVDATSQVVCGSVKRLDEYRGQTQTVLTRAALRVDEPAAGGLDIATGDQVETGGECCPALRADDDIHIRVIHPTARADAAPTCSRGNARSALRAVIACANLLSA